MKYNELTVAGKNNKRRVGRGISAGQGKTAGRGTKGQSSRTGSSRRPGFEGGQNPLMQRLPKLPGFRSIRTKNEVVYTDQLNAFIGNVDNFTLYDAGLVSSPYVKVKVIAREALTAKLDVALQSASKSSIVMIQKNGGTFVATPQIPRSSKKEV